MPVDFLSDEQAQRYGRFSGEPAAGQLARYFYLDDRDRHALAPRRGDHNRLGWALQVGTVRFLGTFLSDPTDVPPGVVRYVAKQLAIDDTTSLERYRTSETRWDHVAAIQRAYGYRAFTDPREQWGLLRWLFVRATLSTERPNLARSAWASPDRWTNYH